MRYWIHHLQTIVDARPHVRIGAMPTKPWDAVIFDYGRVLSQSPTAVDLQEFAALAGISEPPFFETYSETRREYDCGRADYKEHWQCFAKAAGVTLSAEQVERIVELETRIWLRVESDAIALTREIRAAGMQTAILSNMPADLLSDMRKQFDWLEEFAVQIWSCELGVIKPDPQIYRACLEALGCKPERALFFDDRPNNVQAAIKLGIDAHVFESAKQARAIVSARLNGG